MRESVSAACIKSYDKVKIGRASCRERVRKRNHGLYFCDDHGIEMVE